MIINMRGHSQNIIAFKMWTIACVFFVAKTTEKKSKQTHKKKNNYIFVSA